MLKLLIMECQDKLQTKYFKLKIIEINLWKHNDFAPKISAAAFAFFY
jgi:hypothetical protein